MNDFHTISIEHNFSSIEYTIEMLPLLNLSNKP